MKWSFRDSCILTLAFLSLLGGCSSSPDGVTDPSPPPQRVAVATIPVRWSTEPLPIDAAGIISQKIESELSFKTGGVVREIRVRTGDLVAAGDLLAELEMEEIEASVTEARSGAEKATRDLLRAQKLLADRVYTVEQVQNAATLVDQTAASLRSAEFNARHARIIAPCAGRILSRLAEPNETVAAGRAILKLGDTESGWIVRVGLGSADVARVALGDTAELNGDGLAASRRAVIDKIAGASDPNTRTTEVELKVDHSSEPIRSGQVVRVRIVPKASTNRPVVPAISIVEGNGRGAWIYLVERGVAKRVPIQIESLGSDFAYLKTQIPEGAEIVTDGSEFVRDSQPLAIAPKAASAQP